MRRKKGQTWISDLTFAVVIFSITIIVFFAVLNRSPESDDIKNLEHQSVIMPDLFIQGQSPVDQVAFLQNNRVIPGRITEVSQLVYEDLKSLIGVHYDFCIYFEDSEGNLINISSLTRNPSVGIGSPQVLVNGASCGNG